MSCHNRAIGRCCPGELRYVFKMKQVRRQENSAEVKAGSARALRRGPVARFLQQLWSDERGQDIAEYAVMLAVILVIVVGTIRLIGTNANSVFSSVGSSIQ